ncbi:hypothetical protein BN946_scf184989.g36 [Trametes cinnabarina]|uniref:Uncharacterized protein n=1 Tax=Pycnoporus cinnabarinus TaxID=5643 RepID=A0A060S385_PYCCI|nr:hypothetical protein BN946_scf184989.g36 [Trametes cinnabarina]
MYSSYSSASISSVASTSTTSSGRRNIVPLYNLQAHNVLTNVIADAGTDAKVAKFQKRGLEVIGLAVLEPVEVWGQGGNPVPISGNSPGAPSAPLPDERSSRASADYTHPHLVAEALHTPTSSALSLNSEGTSEYPHTPAPAHVTPTLSPATPTTPRNTPGAKKFFGKLFKRRDSPNSSPSFPPSPLPPINAQPPSPAQSTMPLSSANADNSRASRRSSLLLGNTLSIHGHAPSSSASEAPVSARENVVLQPPVLGIQPTLSSSTNPPRGRPTKYVWVVRRWLKGNPESLLSGVKGKFNEARGNTPHALSIESQVEVRFEWTRGKSGKKRGSRRDTAEEDTRSKRHSLALSSAAQSQTSLHQNPHPPQVVISDPPQPKKRVASASAAIEAHTRRSVDSHRSTSPHATASTTTATSDEEHPKISPSTEEGDESDPEDSETPWTCTLVIRRRSSSRLPPPGSPLPSAGVSTAGVGSNTVRIKVAGVVPTPHHPKVVALLKVPFPLPDIEIERMNVRKRIITPAGVARPATSSGDDGNGAAGAFSSSKSSGNGMKNFFNGVKENNGPGAGGYPEGLVLTAEETKDIIATTGLWLVVREGFGGVGRVSRKGDGWRLRG